MCFRNNSNCTSKRLLVELKRNRVYWVILFTFCIWIRSQSFNSFCLNLCTQKTWTRKIRSFLSYIISMGPNYYRTCMVRGIIRNCCTWKWRYEIMSSYALIRCWCFMVCTRRMWKSWWRRSTRIIWDIY